MKNNFCSRQNICLDNIFTIKIYSDIMYCCIIVPNVLISSGYVKDNKCSQYQIKSIGVFIFIFSYVLIEPCSSYFIPMFI